MASPSTVSDAQLAANRENAKRSTGPRHPESKSRTRLNGLRHGLTGQTVLLPEDDREAYDKHCIALLAHLAPQGAVESQIAQSIADDYWRLNRIKAIEDNIFALGIEALDGDSARGMARSFLDNASQINLLSLYEGRLNRAVAKKLAELSELRRIRKVAAAASGDGFGFSNGKTGSCVSAEFPKSRERRPIQTPIAGQHAAGSAYNEESA
jgi:hypothetical protein